MGSLVAELAEKLSAATNSLDFDEQTMFLNTSANTVGIGTNAPASKFDVRGTMQVGIDDTGYDVQFFGDAAGALMLWDTSEDSLYIRGATADHATTSAGRIVLQTNQAAVVDGDRIGQIDFQASNETGSDALLVSASIWAEADDTFDATGNETELVFATGASELAAEKVRITSDGKVGIGTSAPGAHLDVWGPVGTGATGAGVLRLSTAELSVVNADQLGRIEFIAPLESGGTDAILVAASIYAEADDTFAADNNATELVFATAASEAATEKMRITSDGRVAIGTTNPNTALTVEGTITLKEQADADGDTAAYGQIWVNTATPCELYFTTDAGNDIALTSGSSVAGGFDTDAAVVFNESGNDADFRVESDIFAHAIFLQASNSYVGVHEDLPQYWFHVTSTGGGNAFMAIECESSDVSGLKMISGHGTWGVYNSYATSDAFEVRDDSSSAVRLKIDSSGNFTGSGTADISDERLKENIIDLENSLEKICQLRGISYTWKEIAKKDTGVPHLGLIAQEVEEILPIIVKDDSIYNVDERLWRDYDELPEGVKVGDVQIEGESYKSLHMSGLIPVLVEAVKELSAKVTALENA